EEESRRAARDQASDSPRAHHGRSPGLRLPRRKRQSDQSGGQGGFLQYGPAPISRRENLQADLRAVPARNERSFGREEIDRVHLRFKHKEVACSVRSLPRRGGRVREGACEKINGSALTPLLTPPP